MTNPSKALGMFEKKLNDMKSQFDDQIAQKVA